MTATSMSAASVSLATKPLATKAKAILIGGCDDRTTRTTVNRRRSHSADRCGYSSLSAKANQQEEHLRLYSELVDPEEIKALWAERYAATEWPLKRRKLPDDPGPQVVSFILPATQPSAEPKRKPEPVDEPAPLDEPEPEEDEPEEQEESEEAAQEGRVMLPAVIPPTQLPATWDVAFEAMNKRHAIIESYGGKTVIARTSATARKRGTTWRSGDSECGGQYGSVEGVDPLKSLSTPNNRPPKN